jgi:hypothetical protein
MGRSGMFIRSYPLLITVLIIAGAASSYSPVYVVKLSLECAGVPIDVGTYGSPCFQDWNADGLPDLIVGQYDDGKIRIYINEGSPGTLIFNSWTYMQADGTDITLPYG